MRIEDSTGINTSTNNTIQNQATSQLGRDEFLKILITQLQNQDPLNPMDDREFVTQLAQFSTLEQIQSMSADITSMKGLNLIGCMVYAEKYDENYSTLYQITGRVDQVNFISGKPYLRVCGYDLEIDDILQVFSEEEVKNMEAGLDGEEGVENV